MEYTLTYEIEEMELQELLDNGDIAVGAHVTQALQCGWADMRSLNPADLRNILPAHAAVYMLELAALCPV